MQRVWSSASSSSCAWRCCVQLWPSLRSSLWMWAKATGSGELTMMCSTTVLCRRVGGSLLLLHAPLTVSFSCRRLCDVESVCDMSAHLVCAIKQIQVSAGAAKRSNLWVWWHSCKIMCNVYSLCVQWMTVVMKSRWSSALFLRRPRPLLPLPARRPLTDVAFILQRVCWGAGDPPDTCIPNSRHLVPILLLALTYVYQNESQLSSKLCF
jgi:hypothetical protein